MGLCAAGLSDNTIRSDVSHLEQVRTWFGKPLWDMLPADADSYFGTVQRASTNPANTSVSKPLDLLRVRAPRGDPERPKTLAQHRQPAPDHQQTDRLDHPSHQRQRAHRAIPPPSRHPGSLTRRPSTRRSAHPRPRPAPSGRRVRTRRDHSDPILRSRATESSKPQPRNTIHRVEHEPKDQLAPNPLSILGFQPKNPQFA